MPKTQLEVVKKAQCWFDSRMKVSCTGCRYCVPCPKEVSIPEIFDLYNTSSMRGLFEKTYLTCKSLFTKKLTKSRKKRNTP
jgi:predicted aldo/keto reductase-like oxidoreductase